MKTPSRHPDQASPLPQGIRRGWAGTRAKVGRRSWGMPPSSSHRWLLPGHTPHPSLTHTPNSQELLLMAPTFARGWVFC